MRAVPAACDCSQPPYHPMMEILVMGSWLRNDPTMWALVKACRIAVVDQH